MPSRRRDTDACDLLDAGHRTVEKTFRSFEALRESSARSAPQAQLDVAREICIELAVHAQLEEQIFYPALRSALKETQVGAEVHLPLPAYMALIAEIRSADRADARFHSQVKALGKRLARHIEHERGAIFPKARAARKLDLATLRQSLVARRPELIDEQLAAA